MKPYRDYYKNLIEDLKKSPREVAGYLSASLEQGNVQAFLLALRNVAAAYGGIGKIAKLAKLNRVSVYKMLSKTGNPGIFPIEHLLKTMGFHIEVVPNQKRGSLKKAA